MALKWSSEKTGSANSIAHTAGGIIENQNVSGNVNTNPAGEWCTVSDGSRRGVGNRTVTILRMRSSVAGDAASAIERSGSCSDLVKSCWILTSISAACMAGGAEGDRLDGKSAGLQTRYYRVRIPGPPPKFVPEGKVEEPTDCNPVLSGFDARPVLQHAER